MPNFDKMTEGERESKYGYVHAVSGPGKLKSSNKLLVDPQVKPKSHFNIT